MRFDGKVAFITGGAIGLGRAVARGLATQGAAVVLADIDDQRAERSAAEMTASGTRAMAVHCDVADESSVDEAMDAAVAALGGIDILLNNAGLHLSKYNRGFATLSREDLRRLFDVNVQGVVNCSLSCREHMRGRGGGSIVNISSVAADFCGSPYGVSKLAVQGLTVAFAKELSADDVRVNAIAPGFIATENAVADTPGRVADDMVGSQQLVHRLGVMDDIVAAVGFLCSDEAGFITGETLRVSGGFPLRP